MDIARLESVSGPLYEHEFSWAEVLARRRLIEYWRGFSGLGQLGVGAFLLG